MIRRPSSTARGLLLALAWAALLLPASAPAQTINVIDTVAGGGIGGIGDGGPATRAILSSPGGIALDAAGNLYISEFNGHRVRKVEALTGIITTVAGTGVPGYNGDGIRATEAQLMNPRGIGLDAAGNLYIADMLNHRVRRVDAATGMITTIAGTGTAGARGDGGLATLAQLNYPSGIAVNGLGLVVIADRENHRVRGIVRDNLVTLAGTGTAGFSGDGHAATEAQLDTPWGVSMDAGGNVYIADTGNQRIRRVSALSSLIGTVAGTGVGGFNGDGLPAATTQLHNPLGVLAAGAGTIYIADQTNHRIRKASRSVTTVAGSGTGGFSGDGGPAVAAELFYPKDVAMDATGALYLADSENNRVRKLVPVRSTAGDFDGNLKADILWRHANQGDLWLWPMNGPSKGADAYVGTVADTSWVPYRLADLDGDGKTDVVWRNTGTGQIYWWRMNGAAKLEETSLGVVPPAYVIVGSGDFNGDGRDDILWRHQSAGDVWIWLMNGAARLAETYIDTVDAGYIVRATGDLDGDTRADIVWQHGTDGDVWAWLMAGATRLTQAYVGTVADPNYILRGAADHSGDGKVEIEWWNKTNGEVWLWNMDGTSLTSATWVATVADTNWRIAGNGDYDADEKADFVWHNISTGEVWMWLMNGPAKTSESYVATVPDTDYRIQR